MGRLLLHAGGAGVRLVSRALVAGAGYVGSRLTARLVSQGTSVDVVRRSGPAGQDLTRAAMQVKELPDAAWWMLAPSMGSSEPERAQVYLNGTRHFLQGLWDAGFRQQVFVVGSTGVHPQEDGSEVTEEPLDALLSGHAVAGYTGLHSQQLAICAEFVQRGMNISVLASTGIVGPWRTPAGRLRKGMAQARGAGQAYVNLVHVDDLVDCLATAPEWAPVGRVVHVGHGEPGSLLAYYQATARHWQLPAPDSAHWVDDGARGKRISVNRLRALRPHWTPMDLETTLRTSREQEG